MPQVHRMLGDISVEIQPEQESPTFHFLHKLQQIRQLLKEFLANRFEFFDGDVRRGHERRRVVRGALGGAGVGSRRQGEFAAIEHGRL